MAKKSKSADEKVAEQLTEKYSYPARVYGQRNDIGTDDEFVCYWEEDDLDGLADSEDCDKVIGVYQLVAVKKMRKIPASTRLLDIP